MFVFYKNKTSTSNAKPFQFINLLRLLSLISVSQSNTSPKICAELFLAILLRAACLIIVILLQEFLYPVRFFTMF